MCSVYHSLPVTSPRTLRLLVPQQRRDGLLSYRFSVQCLDSAPRYAALSYVWGRPEYSESLILQDSVQNVTSNLISALEKVNRIFQQYDVPLSDQIPLWADQLCIDQSNREERGSQVAMMGDIYSNAESVFVCLGDSPTACDPARIVTELSPHVDRELERYGTFDKIPDISPNEITSCNMFHWEAFRNMMHGNWFSRAWVVQEVGLARDGVVLYGNCSFKWRALITVVEWLCGPAGRLYNIHRLSGWTAREMWLSFDVKNRSRYDNFRPFSFLDLLSHAACRYNATDARDYIFAFLGHPSANAPNSGSEQSSPLVRPNYTTSAEENFVEFAATWLERSNQPYIFSCVSHRRLPLPYLANRHAGNEKVQLPSWCPRWDYMPLGGSRLTSERSNGWYDTSRTNEFCFRRLPANQLEIRGFVHDTVHRVFANLEELSPSMDDISATEVFSRTEVATILKLAYSCWRMLNSIKDLSVGKDSSLEDAIFAFASTTNVGSWNGGDISTHKDGQLAEFEACLIQAQQAYHPAKETTSPFKAALDTLLSDFPSFKRDLEIVNPPLFVSRAETRMALRRLFLTSRGHLGLGPAILTEGDACCVISGAQTPFVLRPFSASTYLLVGECFVHDIMHGEAVIDREQAGDVWENIVLQ